MKPVLFYDMFPFLKSYKKLSVDFNNARVDSAVIDKSKTNMKLTLTLTEPVPPYELREIEDLIKKEFRFESVTISPLYARKSLSPTTTSAKSQKTNSSKTKPEKHKTTVILGRSTKTPVTPMEDITLDTGKATILGEVCSNTSKKIEKTGAWLLSFDLTDYSDTIHISKYMPDKDAGNIIRKIKEGMWLKVSGTLNLNRFTGDIALEPTTIVTAEKKEKLDTADVKRVELHMHTKMSALDAVTDVKDAISRAIKWGHPSIAITDHGVVHSFPYAAAAARGKIKIIYGLEAYFINDIDIYKNEDGSEAISQKSRNRNKHIILLAKNDVGLKNLYKLVTKSHLDHFYRYPIIKKSLLLEHREGLIIGSACESGELFSALVSAKSDFVLKQIAEFYDYLEIQPVCNNAFLLNRNHSHINSQEDLQNLNRRIVELGKTLGKPVVATGDVHFLDPEHEIFRHILLTSKGYDGARDDLPLYLKTTDEMLAEFAYLGEDTAYEVVVKNTRLIAKMCENISPLPPKNKLYPPKLKNSADSLTNSVISNLKKLYGDNPPEIITNLIDSEMKDIISRKYDVVYVAAQKLVAESIKNGYLVGSRGSIGSSIVAFFMGITEVNSLPAHYRCPKCCHSDFESGEGWNCGADMPDANCPKCGELYIKDGFNIPFETFLGFDGDKVPDIDLNFSGEFQEQAHKLTFELFGPENVYRAGTIGSILDKTAFGYVKKYLEVMEKNVTKAEENRLVRGCTGVKRTTGQHPGGLVVIPRGTEITDFCPAQYPADDSEKKIKTTHFEYKFMEENLIKLDALGHDDPTMIKMLEDMTGVNASEIKLDDKGTMSIFSSPIPLGLPDDDDIIGMTGSIGIPEFGTPLTKQMLCDTRPDNFDTLVRLSGFAHGEDVWQGNARELIMTGKAGVSETISCRDDIMLFLISKGIESRYAFSISENVRRGRGLPDGAEEVMIRHNIPDWYIESCKKIKYLFPKAHAVAYVIMAFRIAWFKVNKPLAFYSAYFYRRSQKDSFDAESMIRGINIVKSKIREIKNNPNAKAKEKSLLTTLEACYEFYLRGFEFASLDIYESDPTKFLIVDDKKLRPPLVAVNGLGETTALDVAEARKNNEFISIEDISTACSKLTKPNIEQLKTLGALRDLPDSGQFSMF